MGKDVLSQSEIDSIINALGNGDITSKEHEETQLQDDAVLAYDFRRPNKFSKDQMRTLKTVHDNFSRMLTNFLSAYLRLPVKIKLESSSQVTYEEFIYSLPLPTLVTVFQLGGNRGSALLETNSYFTFPIIDILFGGEGKIIKQARELTEIELSVLRRVNEKILNNLRYAWEDIAEISPEIEVLDTNPQFSQLLASNEAVALLSFSTLIAGNEGFLNLCFPYITLESILNKLSAHNWYTRQSKFEVDVASHTQELEKKLKVAEVDMTAVLGNASISVEEFMNFEEGDVILLDRPVSKPIDLCLGGKARFKIQLGTRGNKMAGVVSEILPGGDEQRG